MNQESPKPPRQTNPKGSVMAHRNEHQPLTAPIEHHPVDRNALHAACEPLAALVLARDAGTAPLCALPSDPDADITPCLGADGRPAPRPLQHYEGKALVKRMVDLLANCGFARIEVSAAPALSAAIESEIEGAEARIVPYLAAHDRQETLQHAGFELFNLGFGTLQQALELAEGCDARGVLVIPCDLACFEERHILMLAEAFHQHEDADAVASWTAWLNRPPYILRRTFLEGLSASPRCTARVGSSYRPLPHLNVHEVVFGEEMLVAQPPASNPQDAFFATCTLSALEAVRAVRAEQKREARKAHAAQAEQAARRAARMNAAYTGNLGPGEPSASDQQLLDAARKVLAGIDRVRNEKLSPQQRDDLAKWDAWGKRNQLDFPLFAQSKQRATLAYLDSAATSQRVGRALDAQHRFDAYENANIYRGAYALSAQSTASFNNARNVVEQHIGAGRRSTVFTANTSTAAGLVALSWGEHNIAEGDTIVVPLAEHHSNLAPWLMLAQRKGARLAYIPVLDDGRIDMDAYRKLLDCKPKLVCVAHISNVLGLVNPVEDMAAEAHAHGARMYVDAAQSFPHMPLNVLSMGADFVAFSAHKAYGPMGLGVLWIAPEAFDEMDPLVAGGGTVSHVSTDSYYLRSQTIQYELGTPPVSQAIGFAAALEYLDELGMDAVQAHGAALTRLLVKALEDFDGVTIWGDHTQEDGLTGLVCFTQASIPANVVAGVFGKLSVAVRSGGHCSLPLHASLGLTGSVRFSFGVHTTVEDIEAGLVALEVCRRIFLAEN